MSERWAACLPASASHALGGLRGFPGVDCAAEGGTIWLRGTELAESLETALHSLPGSRRFDWLDGDLLRPAGDLVPTGRLPLLEWRPLGSFVTPVLPTPALSGRATVKCAVRLERTTAAQTPNVLLTTLAAFGEYALHAPQVRLQRWTFAASSDGRAVVRGLPLPPLEGRLFVESAGVAAPAGWRVVPVFRQPERAEPAKGDIQLFPAGSNPGEGRIAEKVECPLLRTLAEAFGVEPGDLCLFLDDATVEHIAADLFVRATRSAVRRTMEGFCHA